MHPRALPAWYCRYAVLTLLSCLLFFPLPAAMAQQTTQAKHTTQATHTTPASPHTEDRVVRIEPVVRDGRLTIDADVAFIPSEQWRHAMERGLPAYFTAELELVSPRWWWFDKVVAQSRKTWKISYNALTQQWRTGSGDLALPATSLDDALAQIRHIRSWAIADVTDLDVDTPLSGRLRLRLDTSLLAQPLQLNTLNTLNVLNNQGWTLSTPWKTFNFSVASSPSDPS